MGQSRSARLNTVIEQFSSGDYFIYDPDGGQQDFAPDRRVYRHRYKRYLGTTETLTVAKLEQTARVLHEEALGAIPDKEVLNTSASQLVPEELTLGPLTFRWHEEVLRIKTPTESHYLGKTQAAALLDYLYDQRRTILKKSR